MSNGSIVQKKRIVKISFYTGLIMNITTAIEIRNSG